MMEKSPEYLEKMEMNDIYKMSELIRETPFLALNATDKAAIIAFLCNDLLQNKAVMKQIDKTVDSVNNMKKDKYLLECRQRKLKLLHARKYRFSCSQVTE